MKSNYRWSLIVTILAFIISIIMSAISMIILENVTLIISILVTFLFIFIGIIFDIIGVAVTSGDEVAFHSMSARKVKGGRIGVKLMKNASKVSSFCCDVIGDICGIISGSAAVTIVALIIKNTNLNEIIVSLIVTSLISSLTIGGKALGKNFAMKNSTRIITLVAKSLSIFSKK
ncbi:MAG: hypothetical protein IJZ79_04725 [Bacilli bacterium]|nr:hypothetical protein [Bacilli bacterium]